MARKKKKKGFGGFLQQASTLLENPIVQVGLSAIPGASAALPLIKMAAAAASKGKSEKAKERGEEAAEISQTLETEMQQRESMPGRDPVSMVPQLEKLKGLAEEGEDEAAQDDLNDAIRAIEDSDELPDIEYS